MIDPITLFRPLFIVRSIELILGIVCFALVTIYLTEFAVNTNEIETVGDLRVGLTKSHLITIAAFACPFLALSTIITHMMDGEVVEKHIQPLMLAAGGATCNLLSGIIVIADADDNIVVQIDAYHSSPYYATGVVFIVTGIVYLVDTAMGSKYRKQ